MELWMQVLLGLGIGKMLSSSNSVSIVQQSNNNDILSSYLPQDNLTLPGRTDVGIVKQLNGPFNLKWELMADGTVWYGETGHNQSADMIASDIMIGVDGDVYAKKVSDEKWYVFYGTNGWVLRDPTTVVYQQQQQTPVVVYHPIIIPDPVVLGSGTFWDEDFEGSAEELRQNWIMFDGTTCTASWPYTDESLEKSGEGRRFPMVSSDRGYHSGRSLKFHFNGAQDARLATGWYPSNYPHTEWSYNGAYTQSGCVIKRPFPVTRDLYMRWMVYFVSGFKLDLLGTKALGVGWSNMQYHWFGYAPDGRRLTMGPYLVNFSGPYGVVTDIVNLGYNLVPGADMRGAVQGMFVGPETPVEKWVCYEAHIKLQDAGQRNGIYEFWMDGQQLAGYYNLEYAAPHYNTNIQSVGFKFIELYQQDGIGVLYYDRVAVGNQRIGCP